MKEFRLAKITVLHYGNKFDKNKMSHIAPSINFVSRTSTNNGISDVVDRIDTVEPYPAGSVTLAFGGSIGSCFLQEKPFYTWQNVGVIEFPDDVSVEAKLYFVTALEKVCKSKFVTFSDEINKHFKTDLAVKLPVTTKGVPDWEYMQERITELEQERIAELEQYLVVTGLNDYTLTDEDLKALRLSGVRGNEAGNYPAITGLRKEMRAFKMGNLFTAQTGDVDLQQSDVNGKGCFFINSGLGNDGIKGKTDRPAKIFPANTISVDFWGNAFYRDFEYKMATHNHVFSLSGDIIKNGEVGLYLVSRMQHFRTLFSYNNMGTWKKISALTILLPIQTDTANHPVIDLAKTYHPDGFVPDWEYMAAYIRAIEKLVIKDVVDYKDAFIAGTRAAAGEQEVC